MRRTATTGSTFVVRSLLAAVTTGSMVTAAVGIAGADPTDSSGDTTPQNVVAALVADIAQADQAIANLRGDVAAKQQSVNRAVIDLQSARNASTASAGAVKVSETEVTRADERIKSAQIAADQAVRAAYQEGNGAGALINTLGGNDPGAALERASTLRIIADSKRAALGELNLAKTKAVSSRTAARAAQVQADAAAASAAARKQTAEDSITDTVLALNAQEAQQARLDTQRALAQRALDDAKQAQDRAAQQKIYAQYVVDEQQSQVVAPAAPAAAAAAPAPAAAPAADAAAAPAAPAAGSAADPVAVARGFAENIVGQATSFLGISPPAAQAATAAAPAAQGAQAVATGATQQVQSASGMSGAQAIEAVIARGMSVIGVQYAWGGGNAWGATQGVRDGGTADRYGDYNRIGFDCSGFMAYAFAAVGIALPKYSGYQYTTGNQVPISELKRGDMVFRGPGGTQHVAMYLGNNQILESPQSGGAVRVAPFDASTWLSKAVRVINS